MSFDFEPIFLIVVLFVESPRKCDRIFWSHFTNKKDKSFVFHDVSRGLSRSPPQQQRPQPKAKEQCAPPADLLLLRAATSHPPEGVSSSLRPSRFGRATPSRRPPNRANRSQLATPKTERVCARAELRRRRRAARAPYCQWARHRCAGIYVVDAALELNVPRRCLIAKSNSTNRTNACEGESGDQTRDRRARQEDGSEGDRPARRGGAGHDNSGRGRSEAFAVAFFKINALLRFSLPTPNSRDRLNEGVRVEEVKMKMLNFEFKFFHFVNDHSRLPTSE